MTDPLGAPPQPAPAASMLRGSMALPIAAGVLGAACFIGMDSVIKLMAPRYGALQLAFFRFAAGSVFAVLLWAWQRSPLPGRRAWRVHGLRTIFLVISLVCFIHALRLLPLAQAVAISYASPVLVALLAIPLLRERPPPVLWAALALAGCGVCVALGPELLAASAPGSGTALEGMLSAALAALAFAFVLLLARHQAQREPLWTILLVQNLLPLLVLAIPAAWTWNAVTPTDLPLIALAGALGTAGLLSISFAFTHLPASRVAPLEYTGLVWAAGLGYFLFGEVPTLRTAASAALIVGGCLLLLRR
jgi:drug/metabolite transporter (DMT)-like permease